MKKKKALISLCGATMLALAACGSGGQSAASTSSGGVTTMTWNMWIGGTADQEAWQKVADQVATDNPSIKLTLQGAPWGDYWTKLGTQLGGTDAPCVVSIQSLRGSQFLDGLLPLDDLISKNSLDVKNYDTGALQNLSFNSKQYALPYDTGPVILFYNADLFAKAGVEAPKPGWTAADFEAAAAKMKAINIPLLGGTAEDIYLQGLAKSYNGGTPFSSAGKVQANDSAYVSTISWLAALKKQGYVSTVDGADGSADDNAFLAGTVAMNVQGPWALLDLSSKAKFTMGVATMPSGSGGGKTVSAGSGFGISKSCKTPDLAYKAIVSMTSQNTLESLAKQGRAFPGRTAAQPAWMTNASKVKQVNEVMTYAVANAVPAGGSAQAEQLQQLLSQYLPQAINGDKPVADVMATIQKQIS